MSDDNSITLRSSNKADTKTDKKAKTKGPAAAGSSVVEVVKELFKDKEFQLILRNSVTTIVGECIENIRDRLSTSISKNEERIDKIDGSLFDIQNEIDKSRSNRVHIEKALEQATEKIINLEKEIKEHEQYSRRNSLRIYGVDESSSECTDDIVIDIVTKTLDCPLTHEDIDRSHRVGKRRDDHDTIGSHNIKGTYNKGKGAHDIEGAHNVKGAQDNKGAKPRSILVKFCSYRKRSEIMLVKKKLKGSGITIAEDLVGEKFKLLMTARKNPVVENAWSQDGRIFATIKTNGAKPMKKLITSTSQLDNLNLE